MKSTQKLDILVRYTKLTNMKNILCRELADCTRRGVQQPPADEDCGSALGGALVPGRPDGVDLTATGLRGGQSPRRAAPSHCFCELVILSYP